MAAAAVVIGAALALVVRPWLWLTAIRLLWILAAPGWWRRPPFLPRPSPAYLRFRLQTAYGGEGRGPVAGEDLVAYLAWCRASRARATGT